MTDGSTTGDYWAADPALRSAWIKFEWTSEVSLGRIVIYWKDVPYHFQIQGYNPNDPNLNEWKTIFETEQNSVKATQIYLYKRVTMFRILIVDSQYAIGVYEVRAWSSESHMDTLKSLTDTGQPFSAPRSFATDPDPNTFWMIPYGKNEVYSILDLTEVYTIVRIRMWWTYYPTRQVYYSKTGDIVGPNGEDLNEQDTWIIIVFRPDKEIFGLQLGEVGVDYQIKSVEMRYLKLNIVVNYDDFEKQLGAGLREIELVADTNLAKYKPVQANSVWDYPVSNIVNGGTLPASSGITFLPDTTVGTIQPPASDGIDTGNGADTLSDSYWASEFGVSEATLYFDLEYVRNIAGFSVVFGADNWPSRAEVSYWDMQTNQNWRQYSSFSGSYTNIWIQDQTSIGGFQSRWVRLWLNNPKVPSLHPDKPDDDTAKAMVLQVYDFKLFEHRGGGGLFGLENVKTGQYSTISYAQFYPRQWGISSNNDDRSDPNWIAVKEDEKENTTQKVQIVTTFDKYGVVSMYRNGEPYGRKYTRSPLTWGQSYDDSIIVFGVRSTGTFVGEKSLGNFPESNLGPVIGDPSQTHTSFFHGTIHRAVLIKGALLPEEVRGLYQVKTGSGMELGCHCYDACPVGSSKFYPQIPVPCSGSGACRRNETGEAFARGSCDCFPGFYGNACQYHCTEISETGCCNQDDDCPNGFSCNRDSKACGKSCSSNSDCTGGESCNLEWKTCSLPCIRDFDCPGGLKCDRTRNLCAKLCETDDDCNSLTDKLKLDENGQNTLKCHGDWKACGKGCSIDGDCAEGLKCGSVYGICENVI